jgi:hypothetical protein
VEFPSEDELKRRVNIDFCLKNHEVTLTISEWQDAGDSIPAYHLDEVWVHVSKVPHPWRHYLGFWVHGAVIGSTLEVDMLTYRKKRCDSDSSGDDEQRVSTLYHRCCFWKSRT